MTRPKTVCVVPSIRPESMAVFREKWKPLFEKHQVTLITVWDGERPRLEVQYPDGKQAGDHDILAHHTAHDRADLFCRFTDACRNLGFVEAAHLDPDYVLTLDDDVYPFDEGRVISSVGEDEPDPIQQHIDTLNRRVPISWMNTAHLNSEYLRGVPYGIRDEAPVMLSHGVWVGTPDFDGETQLNWEARGGVPYSLPYYVGPIPKGVLFPLCGMNVMVKRDALPYLYFAPMGPDTKVEGLNRMADIWMGVFLKREFDRLDWACYTGGSVVYHSRASDAKKNYEQEKLGREWNEARFGGEIPSMPAHKNCDNRDQFYNYFNGYADKRRRYADLIRGLLEKGGGA